MLLKLLYSTKARKDLSSISEISRRKIIYKLNYYCFTSQYQNHCKPLTGEYKGLFRFRIGDYRAIFQKDSQGHLTILTILRIKHRKNIY